MANSKKYHVSLNDMDTWNGLVDQLAQLKAKVDQLSGGGVVPPPPPTGNYIHAFRVNTSIVGDGTGSLPISKLKMRISGSDLNLLGPFTAVKVGGVLIGPGGATPPSGLVGGFMADGVTISFHPNHVDAINTPDGTVNGPFSGASVDTTNITFP